MQASIIIRAFNAETTIARAIDSARIQDFQGSFEIIVIDDGSVDGTADVLARLHAHRPFTLIRQPNGGAVAAANRGFALATGDAVTLLDSDDVFDPTFLRKSVERLFADPTLDFTYCDYWEEHRGVRRLVKTTNLLQTVAVGTLYRRRSLHEAGFYAEGIFFPEYDILLAMWERWKGARLAEPLFTYHRSEASLTASAAQVDAAIAELLARHPHRRAEIEGIRSYRLSG